MPCYATGSREGDLELSLKEAREKTTEAARAACDALRVVEKLRAHSSLKPATKRWWKEHLLIDRAQEARAAELRVRVKTREQALAKLTPEEREALDL